jgi:5-methylcytosine-specific restriction endonuclease McrA
MAVSNTLRQAVVDRAQNRCEYCRISQLAQEATFHIDHITPQSAGGDTALENLALACVTCSLRKAAQESVADPDTGALVPIFHPRRDQWSNHFILTGVKIVGLTPTGRGTIEALQMNRRHALDVRTEEHLRGRFPV